MMVIKCLIEAQATATAEGLPRAIAIVPRDGKILYLGHDPQSQKVCIWALVHVPVDKDKKPRPFEPHELGQIEFVVAMAGQEIPDQYQFRATVPQPGGVLCLFEKKRNPSLIVSPGIGG